MKKYLLNICLLLIAFSILGTPVFANEGAHQPEIADNRVIQASDYFNSYSASVTFDSSNIIVNFGVYGTGYMNTIGAQKIVLQKYQSGVWSDVKSWTNLYEYNSVYALGGISYPVSSGIQYRAVITFYAANSSGYGTRVFTTDSYTL